MEISEIRSRLDGIDKEILPLFLERMELAAKAAEYKRAHSLPVLDRTREREILARIGEQSGELEQYAHRLYSTLLELSRSYQESLNADTSTVRTEIERALGRESVPFPQTGTVACQGVEGAYSSLAAEHLFPRGKLMFFGTFEAVFDAVESGLCDYGVLPVENSSAGSVREVYDLLRAKHSRIVRSTRLCVRHELLARPGLDMSGIREIRSHEQALRQCSKFINGLDGSIKVVPCPNTAMAAEYAAQHADEGVAAIASHRCGKLYGLVPVLESVQDSDNNYTRFVCIARETIIYPGADRVSLIISCEHRPGALYEVLAKLAALEVDLIKLESCPVPGRDFEFRFFMEMQANPADPRILAMLGSLERECEEFRFLGGYLEA